MAGVVLALELDVDGVRVCRLDFVFDAAVAPMAGWRNVVLMLSWVHLGHALVKRPLTSDQRDVDGRANATLTRSHERDTCRR